MNSIVSMTPINKEEKSEVELEPHMNYDLESPYSKGPSRLQKRQSKKYFTNMISRGTTCTNRTPGKKR